MKRKLFILLIFLMLAAVPAFGAEERVPLRVTCKGEELSAGYQNCGNLYIALEDFLRFGNSDNFSVDPSGKQIYFDPADFDIYIADNKTTDFIKNNSGEVHISADFIGGVTYVPLTLLSDLAELDYELRGERLILYPRTSTEGLYKVNQKCTVVSSLVEGSGNSYTLSPSSGIFFSIKKDFGVMSMVELLSGDTVYIMNDCITSAEESDAEDLPVYMYKPKTKTDYGRRFNIAWDQNTASHPEPADGIDVIAPFEWFYPIVGEGGTLGNRASIDYTADARRNGYRIWATATNAFVTTGSTNFTLETFKDPDMLNKVCAQYLFYCALYDVDGLNVDYEDLKVEGAREGLTKMMQTLSEYTNRMGLDLSIATLVPEEWNFLVYDYAALGECCDYITPMAYDEHYNVASGIGSTSSAGWYERNMRTLCEYVDPAKILMGVPLYCFVCKTDADGSFTSSAKTSVYRVDINVKEAAKNGNLITGPEWIEEDGQYYVEYADGDAIVKIWLEDQRSIARRLSCVYDLGLGGTACWSIDHVENAFFDIFNEVYEQGEDPAEITPDYPLED